MYFMTPWTLCHPGCPFIFDEALISPQKAILSDIDLGKNTITVECGKGNKSRIVPINPPLTEVLFDYLMSRMPVKPDEPVFVVSTGNSYSPTKIQELFAKYRRLSHINKELTVHSLRHSYASLLLQNGVGIAHISTLLE